MNEVCDLTDRSQTVNFGGQGMTSARAATDNMRRSNGDSRRIPSLDGLRGLSIWSVLLTHASDHFQFPLLHHRFTHTVVTILAYFGVTVFFVISGFLITLLLLKEREHSSTVSIGRFYRRRALRILPAFLVYVTVVLILGRATFAQELYAFTFTTSYFFDRAYRPLQQLWSLSVEEQFYLAWPLLMLRGTLTSRRSCWLVMAVCPILRLVLQYYGYREYSHLAPAILDSIAAGCLLAFYQEQVRHFVKRYLVSTGRFVMLCAGTVCFAEFVYRLDLVLLWGFAPCLIALVISAAIERRDRILNSGPLVWSGLLSYSLYLWQQPFLVLDGPLNYLSVRIGLTFVAAYLSFRLIEQPVLGFFAHTRRIRRDARAGTTVIQES